MTNESPLKAILVVVSVALVCSIMVSTTRVLLAPAPALTIDLDRARHVLFAARLALSPDAPDDDEVRSMFGRLRPVLIDLAAGTEAGTPDAAGYDQRNAAIDPEQSIAIPKDRDLARLGRRAPYAPAYHLPRDDGGGIVLPIHGKGMWSTIYGYIGLSADYRTVLGISFYEQAETPGVGDRFLDPAWLSAWRGKEVYGPDGAMQLRVTLAQPNDANARYTIDAISGATVTSERIGDIVRYWLGNDGFGPYLEALRKQDTSP